MFYFECFYPEAVKPEFLEIIFQLNVINIEWEFRRDHAQGIHYFSQPARTNHVHRFCPVGIAHSQKQSRQSADMISMVMGKKNQIDRLEGPSLFLDGYLCGFPTVDQDIGSIETSQQRRQMTARQWHHSSGSQ